MTAQGCIQSGLEILPGWRWFDITGQPAPVHDCRHKEKDPPYIEPEFLLFFFLKKILCLPAHYFFILCLFTGTAVKSLTPSPRWPLHGHQGLLLGPPQSCLFQAEPAQLPQLLLTWQVLLPWASWWPSAELTPIDWCLPSDILPSKDDCFLILMLLQFLY